MGGAAFGATGGNAVGDGSGDGNSVGFDTSNTGDPNLGFDPSIGSDLGMGFGGGGSGSSGGGQGPDTGPASVANTQVQAPIDIQAGGGLRAPGGGPATDQPQPQRYANASAALYGGPKPPGTVSDFSGKGGTPDVTPTMEPWAPQPNTNLTQPDSLNERFPADSSFNQRFPQPGAFAPSQPGGVTRSLNLIPPPAMPDGSQPYPQQTYPRSATGAPAPPPIPVPTPQPRPDIPQPPVTNAPMPQARPPGGDLSYATPPATPPASSPEAAATGQGGGQGAPGMGGQGQGSPLEQIINALFGQGSPLLHLIGRALGINLPPGFGIPGPGFNSPLNQTPGPGQFPAGTVGGRPPLSQFQPPGSPGSPPGLPRAPGSQPSALPRTRALNFSSDVASPDEAGGATGEGGDASQAGDATQYIRDHGGHPAGVGAPDLNPEFASRLAKAGRAYEQETGQKPNFGEMGRSNALQRQYYQQYRRTRQGLAAYPGTSRHERGLATDVPSGPFQTWLHRNAGRFGLEGLRSRADPFHFQAARNQPIGQSRPTASASPTGQRIEINPNNFEQTFANSPLAGQSDAIARAARANGVPPARMASIIAFETGRGQSHMLRAMNNPAGITRGGQYVSYPTIQEGIDAAGRAIGRVYQQTGGDIGAMARIYAPPGVRNDPYGTNRQWLGAVMRFEQSLGM